MAFSLAGFAAGVAENVAETMKKDREDAIQLVRSFAADWSKDAAVNKAKYRNRTKQLEMQAKRLKSKGFGKAQISHVLSTDSYDDVMKNVAAWEKKGYYDKARAADIVSVIDPEMYEDMSVADIIANVQGKIDQGMSQTEALQSLPGAKMRGTFGLQNLGNIMQKQARIISEASGMSLSEMQAYAQEAYVPGQTASGEITLRDVPKFGETDNQVRNQLVSVAGIKFGVKTDKDLQGNFSFSFEKPQRASLANRHVIEAQKVYEEELQKLMRSQPYDPNNQNIAKQRAMRYIEGVADVQAQSSTSGSGSNVPSGSGPNTTAAQAIANNITLGPTNRVTRQQLVDYVSQIVAQLLIDNPNMQTADAETLANAMLIPKLQGVTII